MVSGKLGLWRLLRRSLVHRRARSLSALIALTVSAAVATALLTLYGDLDQKLHHEFRGFGANIVITRTDLSGRESQAQQAAGPGARVAPYAYAVATTDRDIPVVVVGTDFAAARPMNTWWKVSAWPGMGPNGIERGVLLGSKAAQFIGITKQLTLHYGGHTITLDEPVGTLTTGGDEDSRIYVSDNDFAALTATNIPPQGGLGASGVQTSVLEVQVPGGAETVDAAIARLRKALPGADVSPVRQLVEGESNIVDRTHTLMFAAVLLIALTVAVSVLATLSASVLERRRDFALMKALGSSDGRMMQLFLLETTLLATGGVVLGFVLGSAAAWLISEINFQTASLPRISVLPAVIVLNAVIATLAALFPIRALRELEPASLLRGE